MQKVLKHFIPLSKITLIRNAKEKEAVHVSINCNHYAIVQQPKIQNLQAFTDILPDTSLFV